MAESTSGGTTIADRRVADIDCSSEGAFTLQECSVNFPVGETCSAGARQFAGVVCNISSKLVRYVHGLIVYWFVIICVNVFSLTSFCPVRKSMPQ